MKTNTMKRILMLVLSVLMLVSVAFCFACGDEEPEEYIPPRVHEANTNLKYFGYYHSDGYNSKSYFEEIDALDNSNIFLLNGTNSPSTLNNRLKAVKSYGYKAICSPILFEGSSGAVKVPRVANLIDNWQETFANLVDGVKPYLEDGTIYGFYFDEPVWNGVKEEEFRECTKFMSEYMAANVDTTGRGGEPVAIMHCMTVYDIGAATLKGWKTINKSTNDYCTDVTYDAYGKWDDAERNRLLWKLKWVSPDNAKIWGCATGALEGNTPDLTSKLVSSIENMYQEAIWDPRYVGILMFTYPSGGDWGYGTKAFITPGSADYMPEVRKAQIDYGRKIIGKDPIDWNTQYELVLDEPTYTYKVGEEFEIPASSAYNMGTREALSYTVELTTPDGNTTKTVQSFGYEILDQVGLYTLKLTALMDGQEPGVKEVVVAVKDVDKKGVDEVASFESEAYVHEAYSDDDSTWCWPRLVSNEVTHNDSLGALKVIPHSQDGDWMCIRFADGGNTVWDFTDVESVSMWIYVTGDHAYDTLSLYIMENAEVGAVSSMEILMKNKQVIQPGVWTEITLNVDDAIALQQAKLPETIAELNALIADYEVLEDAVASGDSEAINSAYTTILAEHSDYFTDETTVSDIIKKLESQRLAVARLQAKLAPDYQVDLTSITFAYGELEAKKRFDHPSYERNIFYIDDVTITYKTK